LGNLEGVRLSGRLREKKGYLGSFFLDPEGIRKLSIGAIWVEQGSFNLV
jgi:hypothetical protein